MMVSFAVLELVVSFYISEIKSSLNFCLAARCHRLRGMYFFPILKRPFDQKNPLQITGISLKTGNDKIIRINLFLKLFTIET